MQILVTPDTPALLPYLRAKDEIVVRAATFERLPALMDEMRDRSLKVNAIIVPVGPLASFLESGVSALKAVDCNLVLEASEPGEFAPLLRGANALEANSIRVKLPLRTRRDLQAIKILTSLLVRVIVDLTDGDLDWDLAEEAMVDCVLSPVPRGTLDPFSMLASIVANTDSRFTLGSVYFDDGQDYLQVDDEGKAYGSRRAMRAGTPLDVELSERDQSGDCLGCTKKAQSRDELRTLSACAFCEGYRYCKGYLSGTGPDQRCRQLLIQLAEAVQARPNPPERPGRGK